MLGLGGLAGEIDWRQSLQEKREEYEILRVRVRVWHFVEHGVGEQGGGGLEREGTDEVGLVDVVDDGGTAEEREDDNDEGQPERRSSSGRSASSEFFARVHYFSPLPADGDSGSVKSSYYYYYFILKCQLVCFALIPSNFKILRAAVCSNYMDKYRLGLLHGLILDLNRGSLVRLTGILG